MTREEIDKIASDYLNDCESELDMLEVFVVAKESLEQGTVLDKIRAEIVELTKCPYGIECLGANCPSNTDCMICGDHVLEIIDKYKAESVNKK